MSKSCFECGKPALHEHHVVPRSMGGTKTVWLCLPCHGKVHKKHFVKSVFLQRVGIEKAKALGKYKGRKIGTFKVKPHKIIELYNQGVSIQEIAEQFNLSKPTVYRCLQREKGRDVDERNGQ